MLGRLAMPEPVLAYASNLNPKGAPEEGTPFKVEHYANGIKQAELQFTAVRYAAAEASTARH